MGTFDHYHTLSEVNDEAIQYAVRHPDAFASLINRMKQIVVPGDLPLRVLSTLLAPVLRHAEWAKGSFRMDVVLHEGKGIFSLAHMTPTGTEQSLGTFGLNILFLFIMRAANDLVDRNPDGFTIEKESTRKDGRYGFQLICTPKEVQVPLSSNAPTIVSKIEEHPLSVRHPVHTAPVPRAVIPARKMTQYGVAPPPATTYRITPPSPPGAPEATPKISSAPPPISTERAKPSGPFSQRIVEVRGATGTSDPRRDQTIPPDPSTPHKR